MHGGFRSVVGAVLICALAGFPAPVQSRGTTLEIHPTDAKLSLGFGQGGILRLPEWTSVRSVVELGDGRLLVHLEHALASGVVDRYGLVRLMANGAVDPSFAATGPTPGSVVLPVDTGKQMVVRSSGAILFGDGAVRQFTADGQLDVAFGSGGTLNWSSGPVLELDDDSLLLTFLSGVEMNLLRVSSAGVVQLDGLIVTPVRASIVAPVRMPGGGWRLVTSGNTGFDPPSAVIALTPGGDIDNSFGGGDGFVELGNYATIYAAESPVIARAMPDGRLVAAFNEGSAYYSIVRLKLSGAIDTSFDGGQRRTCAGVLMSVDVEHDGSMTLGVTYRFDHPPNPYLATVVRTAPNGEVDQRFQPRGWTPGSVWLAELGVPGYSVGGTVTTVSGGAVIVGTAQYVPDLAAVGVAQLTRLQLPPWGRVSTLLGPAEALAPAVRLMNAHRP